MHHVNHSNGRTAAGDFVSGGRPHARVACFLMAIAVLTTSAAAQDMPPTDPMDGIRAKSVLDDSDRTAIRAWISQRLDALKNDDRNAVNELRSLGNSTSAFRQAYAVLAVDAIRGSYAQAKGKHAAQMLALSDPALREKIGALRAEAADKVLAADAELRG